MAEAEDEGAPWVALGVYAEQTGQHIDAVRAAVRRRRLKARKGNDGRWLVALPPEAGLGSDLVTPRPSSGTPLALAEAVAELRTALSAARSEAAAARAEAATLREELAASRVNFARSEAERRAAQAVAVADVATARAEVEAAHKIIAVLEEQLHQARRPWWRRWLGQRPGDAGRSP